MPFKGEKDMCEEIEKAAKDPEAVEQMRKYNMPAKCPIPKVSDPASLMLTLITFSSKYSPQDPVFKCPFLRSSLNVRDHVSQPYSTTSNIIVLYILIFKFLEGRYYLAISIQI